MAFTEIDEKLLVKAYQAGDERAFDTIVRTQYQALFAHAVRRLRQHEAAEDAVQDTLLRAYRALPNLDGDLALKAWLHRILTNVCHDEGNRIRRQQGLIDKVTALPEELAEDPAEEAVLHDTVRVMSEALKDLPESYREALVLRYVDGLSFREVAEAAGVTEENARARVHRGRQALHKIMTRLAVLAAFIIPGVRRTQTGTPAEISAATPVSADTLSLTTQLTSHAVNAAPHVGRLAELSSAMPGGKSTLAVAAFTAVAAVAAPVAYTVNEVRKPERPPAAVAAPAPDTEPDAVGGPTVDPTPAPTAAAGVDAPGKVVTPDPTTSTTETTLPPSAADPFRPTPTTAESPRPTTTTTPPTTVPPADVEPAPAAAGRLATDVLAVAATGNDFDLEGSITLADGRTGSLGGRVRVQDEQVLADDLRLVVGDVEHVLRLRGPVSEVLVGDDGERTYTFTGAFVLTDGTDLGLPERGEIRSGSFRPAADQAHLTLELEGPASPES